MAIANPQVWRGGVLRTYMLVLAPLVSVVDSAGNHIQDGDTLPGHHDCDLPDPEATNSIEGGASSVRDRRWPI